MAFANKTDEARVALVVIFMDRETIFDGRSHPITNGRDDIHVGLMLDGALFPITSST